MKNRTTISSNFTSGYLSEENSNKEITQKDILILMVIVALFTTAKIWKQRIH